MKISSDGFYGNTSKNVLSADFRLTETVYAQTIKLPVHSHEAAYFCFVLEGDFTEFYGRRSRLCHPSTLVFHPAGETHSDYFHTDTRCFNIQMSIEWFERVRQHSNVISTPAHFCDIWLSSLAARLYRESCEFDNFSPLVVEGLTLEILAESSRRCVPKSELQPPRWLRQAREILDERFDESLTLIAISELVEVHPVHLAREFRRFYRSTVGEYVRRRRIETACRKLSSSDSPLSDIALTCGFFDQSHFTRTFKLLTGMTPLAYRTAFRPR